MPLLALRLVSAVGMLIVDNLQQLCRLVDDGGDSDDDDNGVVPAGELPAGNNGGNDGGEQEEESKACIFRKLSKKPRRRINILLIFIAYMKRKGRTKASKDFEDV